MQKTYTVVNIRCSLLPFHHSQLISGIQAYQKQQGLAAPTALRTTAQLNTLPPLVPLGWWGAVSVSGSENLAWVACRQSKNNAWHVRNAQKRSYEYIKTTWMGNYLLTYHVSLHPLLFCTTLTHTYAKCTHLNAPTHPAHADLNRTGEFMYQVLINYYSLILIKNYYYSLIMWLILIIIHW